MTATPKKEKGLLQAIRRSKRAIFGIGILSFYIIIALAAPIIDPNDPLHGFYMAGDFAVPSFYRYLPGQEKLSENFMLVTDSGFPTPASLWEQWNFTRISTGAGNVSLRYDPAIGEGSAAIVFRRTSPTKLAQRVEASLSREFLWPYYPPIRFSCKISVFAKGSTDTSSGLSVPARVSVIIKPVEGNVTYPIFWTYKIENPTSAWISPSESYPPITDSYDATLKKMFGSSMTDPAQYVFSEPGRYSYYISILFEDNNPKTLGKTVETTVYLDDLNVRLYGASYGLLGTDQYGRDIFAQFLYGARISLYVGLLSAILSVVIGLFVGLVAGYIGGFVDEISMRLSDMLLVLPGLPLLIVLMAVLGTSLFNLILIIGVLGWMGFSRVVRSQTLSLKERPFVEAAKAVGASRLHIIRRHILPNVMSLVYVSLALSVPSAIISEAALSWLGLFDPSVISWGRMLFDAQVNEGIERLYWIIPPGISIALVSLSFILLGYALDEILNPKLRARR